MTVNPLAKLALFVLALLAVFGGGLGVGAAVGPLDDDPPSQVEPAEHMP